MPDVQFAHICPLGLEPHTTSAEALGDAGRHVRRGREGEGVAVRGVSVFPEPLRNRL